MTTPSTGRAGYRQLWNTPGAPFLLAGYAVARLPTAVVGLTLILATLERTHSLTLAGLVPACYAIAMGAGMPVTGRLVDTRGPRLVLAVTGVAHAAALVLFAGLTARTVDLPVALLPAVAAAAGATLPPVVPVVRAHWAGMLDETGSNAARAAQSLLLQCFFVVGPAIVGLFVYLRHVPFALLVAAMMTAAGVALVAIAPGAPQLPRRTGRTPRLAALRQPGIPRLLAMSLAFAAAYQGVDFGLVAWAARRHEPALAGLALAVASVGGLAAAAALGAVARLLAVFTMTGWFVLWAASLAGLGLVLRLDAGLTVVSMTALVVASLAAPLISLLMAAEDAAGSDGLRAESASWRMSATISGVCLGTAVCGLAATTLGVAGPAVVGVCAALVAAALAGPPVLAPAPVPEQSRRRWVGLPATGQASRYPSTGPLPTVPRQHTRQVPV